MLVESMPASRCSRNGETDESCAESSKEADGDVHVRHIRDDIQVRVGKLLRELGI
jgi:hypothetical protein